MTAALLDGWERQVQASFDGAWDLAADDGVRRHLLVCDEPQRHAQLLLLLAVRPSLRQLTTRLPTLEAGLLRKLAELRTATGKATRLDRVPGP